MKKPYYAGRGVTLYHGDALRLLGQLEVPKIAAVITDPPPLPLRSPDKVPMTRDVRVELALRNSLDDATPVGPTEKYI